MKAAQRALVVLPFIVVLVGSGFAFGQNIQFQDDFSRGDWPWQNAMTHQFLPAWSVPTANYIPPAANTHTQFDLELRVTGQTFTFLAGPTSGVSLVYTYTDPDGDLKPGSVGLLSWGNRSASSDVVDTGYHPLGLECLSFSCTDDAAPTPNHLFPAETWVLPQSWTRLLTKNSAGASGAHSDGTDYRADTYGNIRWDFSRGIFIDDTNWYMNATATTPNIDFMGVTMTCNGGTAWTNYEVKTRILSTDNDGLGLLLRATDANNFYRVTFCSEGPGTGTTRPPQGVSVQKCRGNSTARTWTELARDASFIYTPNRPFDVKAVVQDDGTGGVNINITVIDDPMGTPTTYTLNTINDPAANNPIPAGSAGLHVWGNDAAIFGNYGGVSTPLVVTTADPPVTLVGDVFTGYNNWVSTYNDAVPPKQGRPASWGIRLLSTIDLIEPSDGCQERGGTYADPHAGGVANDGTYVPYLMVKGGGFTTGTNNYIVKARLRSWDNDGMGLVFGYQDDNNYFRVGVRNEASSSYGFAQGASFQKVVDGVITNLYTAVPSRGNLGGVWVQKLNTGGIEQAGNHGVADGSGTGQRAEFQGPRLVRGDANWTDYTYENVIEVHDDDALGLLFRYQDEQNYYRLTFCEQDSAGGPPKGISIQKVVAGVGTQLWSDTDDTKSGDNDLDATAGFIYGDVQSPTGFRTWRTHLTATGGTFRIVIDGIADDGTESPAFYAATVTDASPLTHGKVGIFTWSHNANEFRDFKLTLAGQSTPVFFDGNGAADPKGWVDATLGVAFTLGVNAGTTGVGAGAPCSGIGLRPDLQALGVRDNRYIQGTTYISPGPPINYVLGATDWEGPRAVAGLPNWKDYTYAVDLRALDDDGIGIVARYQDEDNFYRLTFLTQSNNTLGPPARGVSLQKRRNGTWSEIWSGGTGFLYQVGETFRVELTATGVVFHLKVTVIDGDASRIGTVYEPADFTDPTDPILAGKIGVTCWGMDGQVNEPNFIGTSAKSWLNWTTDLAGGAVFDNVSVVGHTGRSVPDFNNDKHVDQTDLILFQACFTGPNNPMVDPTPICRLANQDGDLDVDLDDFAVFQRCFSGILEYNADCIK